MSPFLKIMIGLAATALMVWIHHGPAGNGAALIDRLERQAQTEVAKAEVPGVTVRMERSPLSRDAILAGPADRFQREGQGELKGLNDVVGEIEGIRDVRWANPPPAGGR